MGTAVYGQTAHRRAWPPRRILVVLWAVVFLFVFKTSVAAADTTAPPWNPALGHGYSWSYESCSSCGEWGIDIPLPLNTPVDAPEAGTVIRYEPASSACYDWAPGRLLFQLDRGGVIGFGHVTQFSGVGVGQHVNAGTEIATIGPTASCDGGDHVEFMYAPGGCSAGSSCYVHTDFRCSPGCGSGPEYSLGDPLSPWTLLQSYFNPAPPPPPAAPSFLPPGALNRYAKVGDHWITTGGTPGSGYGFESTLGFLALDPGSNERRLYSCVTGGGDHFVSPDEGCEGQSYLGALGNVYKTPPRTGLEILGLYRCTVNQSGDHFVSGDPGCEGQHRESLLGYVTASQDRFDRYVMPGDNHVDTARGVGFGAVLESTLGFVLPNPAPGRQALYSCFIGNDQFTSLDPGCEGQHAIGLEGWLYSSPHGSWPQKVAIYRCTVRANGEHFVSADPSCEGQHTEALLGYLAQTQTGLDRFANPATGDHWVTTRAVGSGYQFEGRLGYMLQQGGPNRRALYSCVIGTDHFMSPDPRCEGQNLIGLDGWAYSSPPTGQKVTAIYRCTVKASGEHFVSLSSSCEGQHVEALLGCLAATPAGAFAPAACIMPRLLHRTLAQARAALAKGHCALGAVHRPRHHRRGHVLRVARQSAKPGSRHFVGFRVRIWLR